jgi:hypothetical protein
MRRISAILLLGVLALTAAIPLVFADSESARPVCCRRNGKHQCAMNTAQQPESAGPVFRAARATCVYFPNTGVVPSHPNVIAPEALRALFAAIVSQRASQTQPESRQSICFSRNHQKRGPPVFLS